MKWNLLLAIIICYEHHINASALARASRIRLSNEGVVHTISFPNPRSYPDQQIHMCELRNRYDPKPSYLIRVGHIQSCGVKLEREEMGASIEILKGKRRPGDLPRTIPFSMVRD